MVELAMVPWYQGAVSFIPTAQMLLINRASNESSAGVDEAGIVDS